MWHLFSSQGIKIHVPLHGLIFEFLPEQWAMPLAELHYCDGTPLTAQYLLVVDALNFCFHPGEFV